METISVTVKKQKCSDTGIGAFLCASCEIGLLWPTSMRKRCPGCGAAFKVVREKQAANSY